MTRNNPYNSDLPPDALALLEDPRVEGMVDPLPGFSETTRVLEPTQPPRAESLYLRLRRSFESKPDRNAIWVNKPEQSFPRRGNGTGFTEVKERPRIEQATKAPTRLFHLWEFYRTCFIASPDMVDLLRRHDPEAIEGIPIDWVFSDGQALDGYQMIDIVRLHYAYDFNRSPVVVSMQNGRKFPRLQSHRVVRDDIPADAMIFREAFYRSELFVAKPLATEIMALASRELRFENVHTNHTIEFPRPAGKRVLQARLKPAEVAVEDESMPIGRRIDLCVVPLLLAGKFAEAEQILKGWLRARPASPFHIIAELNLTTAPQTVATYFDEFAQKAAREYRLEAVYAELNGFSVNTDVWFCNAFGFSKHGGVDGYDWLGDFRSSEDENLVIDGLEPLQELFADRKHRSPRLVEDSVTLCLTEALVIVKFQRLLQRALPLMKSMKSPLIASAHDYDDYVAEILPGEAS